MKVSSVKHSLCQVVDDSLWGVIIFSCSLGCGFVLGLVCFAFFVGKLEVDEEVGSHQPHFLLPA